MALMKFNMAQELRERAKAERENRAAKIAVDMFEHGIISHTSQRSINGEYALRRAWENYVRGELKRQQEKGSTATFGKGADSFNRCKKAANREMSLDIVDVACRSAGQFDIMISCDEQAAETLGKSRTACEIKTGGGGIANGATMDECWQVLAEACETDKWLVWYFDYREFDIMGKDAWDKFDELPCIFLPMDMLVGYLAEYRNKGIDTWLKVNGETAINFQNVITSDKKLAWLYKIYNEYSYDWPTFRDRGRLVKPGE